MCMSSSRARQPCTFILLALLLRASCQSSQGRPCTDGDWRFKLGDCGAGGTRNVYAYVPSVGGQGVPVCDAQNTNSKLQPAPLLDVPCDTTSCPAGTRLAPSLTQATDGSGASPIQLRCETCPAGRFSLGGGTLISGLSADWRRPWPAALTSSCEFKDEYYHWRKGSATFRCTLRVETPSSVAGAYRVSAAPWNRGAAFKGVLVVAPGDGMACTTLEPWTAESQVGGATEIPILLAWQGGCAVSQKASVAAKAGAAAVLVIDSMYHANFVDAPADSATSQQILAFHVGRSDGDILIAALSRHSVVVNVTSPSCAAPLTNGQESTSSSLQYGCAPWTSDASGRFVNSGNNSAFNSLTSTLSWTVTLVRDGYVAFRYRVDAESGFDGLRFYVDWKSVMSLTSQQRVYAENRVELKAGTHILEWEYSKDVTEGKGEDAAQIELIEVVGTAYSDVMCLHCQGSGTHSTAGAGTCNACGQNWYLQHAGQQMLNLTQCLPCPQGTWSPSGSIGNESCQKMQACTPADVESSFTVCHANKRYRQRSMKQPVICDTSSPVSDLQLGTSSEPLACEPCQPHEWRPAGGECVPKAISCLAGFHGIAEMNLSYWYSWPKNVTREVWTMYNNVGLEGVPGQSIDHGWQLEDSRGAYAFVGDLGDPSTLQDSTNRSTRYGDAKLHLSLGIAGSGELSFWCDVVPSAVWGREAYVLIDGISPVDLRVEPVTSESGVDGAVTILAHARIPEGSHRITWVWQYRDDDTEKHETRGLRLRRVVVRGAAGAGISRCERCPLGSEVSADGLRCVLCSPGSFSSEAKFGCAPCAANHSASQYGSTLCKSCGNGTYSVEGSLACAPSDVVFAPRAFAIEESRSGAPPSSHDADGLLRLNVTTILEAWHRVSLNATGPFEIHGRQYLLGLLQPVPPPGLGLSSATANTGTSVFAHVWRLDVGTPSTSLSPHERTCAGGAGESGVTDVVSMGSNLNAVSLVDKGGVRGIRISYDGGDPCAAPTAQHGATPDRHSVQFVFRCDPTAPARPALARRDATGVYHLSSLAAREASSPTVGTCRPFEIEWATRAACPLCRAADFAPRPSVEFCSEDGYRNVSFIVARPCVDGIRELPQSRERCSPTGVVSGISVGAAEVILASVLLAVILSCCLCSYACYLHRTYGKYVAEI